MEIKVSLNEKELTVAPIGRLDSTTSGEFEDCLKKYFTEDIEELYIDFAAVDFISSKGLRVIVSTYKELNNRKMVILSANASVKDVFRLSGLLKVIDIR